jgi:transcriptional regulator of met regulon
MSQAMEATATTIQVSLPFEVLAGMVIQLDTDRLWALRRAVDETLKQRQSIPQPLAETDLEPNTPTAQGSSQEAQEEISRGATEFLKKLGIEKVKPVGPERLREMMRECGIREEDNEFSREIIAMREE